MHLDYEMNSANSPSMIQTSRHQLTPCIYAASIIDETGLVTNTGPTYVSIRSAKHDRIDHETHAIDFERLIYLKDFEKVARDAPGRVKPIVIINVDSSGPENHMRYPQTLQSAIEKFKKYNLDVLIMMNQAPGQSIFNMVERRLSPLSHDLAGLILPHDHFGTHLNDSGVTEHAELEKENFKKTAEILSEVWSMNVLDEYPVIAEYISPSPLIDKQVKIADCSLTLEEMINRICTEEEEEDLPLEQRLQPTEHLCSTLSAVTIKKDYDIDE